MHLLLCTALLLLVTGYSSYGQPPEESRDSSGMKKAQKQLRIADPKEAVSRFLEAERKGLDSSQSYAYTVTDPRLDSVQFTAWKSYYNYMNTGYKHRERVFIWQLVSSFIIFIVVIFLVLCGVYFAWLQFRLALKQMKTGQTAATALATELSAAETGIKVSSPVLGVIILVISLLFFYLYLVHVYPIHETF